MKKIVTQLKTDSHLTLGLVLFTISVLLFVFTVNYNSNDFLSPVFLIHYSIAIVYSVYLIIVFKKRFFAFFTKSIRKQHILLLFLFNISAYSLNRSMSIFDESVPWLIYFLVAEHIVLFIYIFKENNHPVVNHLILFLTSIFLLFNFYQAIVVLPLYGISIPGLLFLGISMHTFVPLFFVICFMVIFFELIKIKKAWISPLSALLVVTIPLILFINAWNNINQSFKDQFHNSNNAFNNEVNYEIPSWINVSQSLDFNYATEKYLKSGLMYQEFQKRSNLFWSPESLNFDGQKKHDPIVTLATFFGGKPEIDPEDQLKILNFSYDMHHEVVDRFWSGENLKTSDLVTNLQLFPSFRMAYTEMTLKIKNENFNERSSWRSQEEAIYTFQLPEGSVISSLSLWIDGMESKARLTTKSKAEKAYSTIVGREMRDPSTVFWMEGNLVRVRVFPCTPQEQRQFKIGITSPLYYSNNQLTYHSIDFKGPSISNTKSTLYINSGDKLPDVTHSTLDLKSAKNHLSWTGKYSPQWSLTIKSPELSKDSFNFKNHSYQMEPLFLDFENYVPDNYIIDLNNGWSKNELSSLYDFLKGKIIFAYNAEKDLHPITSKDDLINLKRPNFTLFPFHKLKNIEKSLIITKSSNPTPNLEDLEESDFKTKIFDFFSKSESKPRIIDFGSLHSGYLKSLIEFKILNYQKGDLNLLKKWVNESKFPYYKEVENIINIPLSGIKIIETRETSYASPSPDHLYRLFNYNSIMQNIGKDYFNNTFINDTLISKASSANIVTPLSSLIVLETLKDYERFDIDENKDSLGNAQINSSGAVPEPHEWAIILVSLAFFLFVFFRKRITTCIQ